jgi:hypothetical protein
MFFSCFLGPLNSEKAFGVGTPKTPSKTKQKLFEPSAQRVAFFFFSTSERGSN